MRRDEFKQHHLWAIANEVTDLVEKISETAAQDELVILRRIAFLISHTRSYRELANVSELFNEQLLAPALSALGNASASLRQRATNATYRQYTDQALVHAENLLVTVSSWPRPYAKGAQAQQMKLLYEEIQLAQARELERIEAKYVDVQSRMESAVAELIFQRDQVELALRGFQAEAGSVASAVDQQKERVDKVINDGLQQVNHLMKENSEAFSAWTEARQIEWDDFAEQNQDLMDRKVNEAGVSLDKLKSDEAEFANLTTAITGQKLAKEFAEEAKTSQVIGLILYGLGFVALALAAVPLFMLMGERPVEQTPDVTWQHFAIRLSLGVLGASAATVLIRLGARFLTNSSASKRMALELQTFGPFLANVRDKETVDAARLELIDRAFGKSYAPSGVGTETSEDVVPVTALAQIVDMVKALR